MLLLRMYLNCMFTNPCSNYAKAQSDSVWFPECTSSSFLKLGMIFVYFLPFDNYSILPIFQCSHLVSGSPALVANSFIWEMVHIGLETNTFAIANMTLITSPTCQ